MKISYVYSTWVVLYDAYVKERVSIIICLELYHQCNLKYIILWYCWELNHLCQCSMLILLGIITLSSIILLTYFNQGMLINFFLNNIRFLWTSKLVAHNWTNLGMRILFCCNTKRKTTSDVQDRAKLTETQEKARCLAENKNKRKVNLLSQRDSWRKRLDQCSQRRKMYLELIFICHIIIIIIITLLLLVPQGYLQSCLLYITYRINRLNISLEKNKDGGRKYKKNSKRKIFMLVPSIIMKDLFGRLFSGDVQTQREFICTYKSRNKYKIIVAVGKYMNREKRCTIQCIFVSKTDVWFTNTPYLKLNMIIDWNMDFIFFSLGFEQNF